MLFCDFCKIFKNTIFWFFRRYLKTYQNDINWGNNSDFNANTEHIFVCCDNFGSRDPE